MKNWRYLGFKRKATLLLACITLGSSIIISGCDNQGQVAEEPTSVIEEPAEPVVEEPIVEEPEEPEEESEVEEVPLPNFILYDEDGNYYKPQQVTSDDIYAKIAEVEEKYGFKSDWYRDVYISNLLKYNSGSMDISDIEKVYSDYLQNLGYKVIQQQGAYLGSYIGSRENEIPMSEYFIDPVLAEEASVFENLIDKKSRLYAAEKFNKLLKENNYETYDYEMYNDLLLLEENIYGGIDLSKGVLSFYSSENYKNFIQNSGKKYDSFVYKKSGEFENYQIIDYVSSHQD